jgi:hypothetical protein
MISANASFPEMPEHQYGAVAFGPIFAIFTLTESTR